MTVDYHKVWSTMNDLELVTSKICSARANIDVAIDKLQEHEYDKAELLMTAAYEYLEYYLKEFDDKFKLAWQATVGDLHDNATKAPLSCDKDDSSPECQGAWNDFWEDYYPEESQQYTEEEMNAMCDKAKLDAELEEIRKAGGYEWTPEVFKKKWVLPVSEIGDNYFVIFPQDLLDAAKLKEGDQVEWVDNGNGSYLMRKI